MEFSKQELIIIAYCFRFGPKSSFNATKKALLASTTTKGATIPKEHLKEVRAKCEKYLKGLKESKRERINIAFINKTIEALEGILKKLNPLKFDLV